MPFLTRLLPLALLGAAIGSPATVETAPPISRFHFHVAGATPGSWPSVLSSVGLLPGEEDTSQVVVVRAGDAAGWLARVEAGTRLIVEGGSPLAQALGFRPTQKSVLVRGVIDRRDENLEIIWEQEQHVPVFDVPKNATVFARERRQGAPLLAGFRHGQGSVLWVATDPGEHGYERYPYLVHALLDLGWTPPVRSRRLWAFFDGAYRARVDIAWFAQHWRRAGIAALHVAAWHYWEPDTERDAYLNRLIAECHRNAIQVYAWVELPHVSERFWDDHPEWREQTAVLQDAHLDWRKLMNLANPDCRQAVASGLETLLGRFDWDGVNLAELYFESLEGAANPARFTPMNQNVRTAFQALQGFDPLELFSGRRDDPESLRLFLDYRSDLAVKLQEDWIAEVERIRAKRPHLDLVLTHVDDRYDDGMRDLVGADSGRTLPLMSRHDFTFLIEDPATVWDHGPSRYTEIATRYRPAAPQPGRLAIDINIVERYQDVYPTKQQTGAEFLQLVHLAAAAFPRVALYSEHSLARADLPLLPAAAARISRAVPAGEAVAITAEAPAGVAWPRPALVDGLLWPAADGETVWLPAGTHLIEPAHEFPPIRLLDFNGELESAEVVASRLEIAYRSPARAYAVLDTSPAGIEIDGAAGQVTRMQSPGSYVMVLPRGQHIVSIGRYSGAASVERPGLKTTSSGGSGRVMSILESSSPVRIQRSIDLPPRR